MGRSACFFFFLWCCMRLSVYVTCSLHMPSIARLMIATKHTSRAASSLGLTAAYRET